MSTPVSQQADDQLEVPIIDTLSFIKGSNEAGLHSFLFDTS